MADDEELKQLAKQIKRLYTAKRRALSGGKYTPNKRWKKCWLKIAEVVNSLECDFVDYVEAQFNWVYPFPHPNTMYGGAAKSRYKRYVDEGGSAAYGAELAKRFEFMAEFVATRLGVGFTLEEILTDGSAPLSPVFRVCIAHENGIRDVTKALEVEAEDEHSSHPAYKEIYPNVPWEDDA